MQQVSIQQAAANALASYLQAKLVAADGLSDLIVNTRWPVASKNLPPRAITVLIAGEMQKEACAHLVVSAAEVPGSPTKLQYTIQQFQCRLPLQLDVWATSDVARDDLAARIDDLLNRGTSELPGAFNEDPFGEGLTLLLGDKEIGSAQPAQWLGTVLFWFESLVPHDAPDAVERSEWRSSARGEAHFCMTTSRIIDRLLSPALKLTTRGAATSDIYRITGMGRGFVWSSGSA